jgi:hypothetical protein
MVAGKKNAGALEREGDMVRGVAGRRHRFQCVTFAFDNLAVSQRVIRHEIFIAAGIERRGFAEMQIARGTVRALAVGFGAGGFGDRGCGRRVVAVRVRDQNLRDGFTAERGKDRVDMAGIGRARIDDGDRPFAYYISVGALERERARVVGDDAPDARGDLGDFVRFHVKRAVELDFFGHFGLLPAGISICCGASYHKAVMDCALAQALRGAGKKPGQGFP